MGRGAHKTWFNTKTHIAVDANDIPALAIVTSGTRYDSKEACALIDGLYAKYLLAAADKTAIKLLNLPRIWV